MEPSTGRDNAQVVKHGFTLGKTLAAEHTYGVEPPPAWMVTLESLLEKVLNTYIP